MPAAGASAAVGSVQCRVPLWVNVRGRCRGLDSCARSLQPRPSLQKDDVAVAVAVNVAATIAATITVAVVNDDNVAQ